MELSGLNPKNKLQLFFKNQASTKVIDSKNFFPKPIKTKMINTIYSLKKCRAKLAVIQLVK